MGGPHTPPLEVSTAHIERLDDERLALELTGAWHDLAAAAQRLTLVIDADGRQHRFPAVPRPRQAVGPLAPRFEARFNLPGSFEAGLAGRMTLLVGDTEIALPPPRLTPDRPAGMAAGPAEEVELLAPLRQELAERARVEARLRTELAALRARVDARGPAAERLESVRRELADELVRVRRSVEIHEQRRDEVESRAMVLAAELETRREECEGLRARVAELEAEVEAARREAAALRTAELSARAGREAALAEVGALHDELERLAAGGPAAESGAGELELERAQALLAEARALTASLG